MDASNETVAKIRRFSQSRQKVEEEYEQQPLESAARREYNDRLDLTLKDLQEKVQRQDDDIQKDISNLQSLSDIGTDSRSRLSQVRRAKKAYDSLLQSEHEMPIPGTPLPTLLAIEEIERLVNESKASVSMTAANISANRQRLKGEEANLQDARAIRRGLEERIEKIEDEKSRKEEKSPSQLAREFIAAKRSENAGLSRDTEHLKTALHKFVDDTLAAMLAAEGLGGPTVGDAVDVPDVTLEAGYTNHGKPKKPKGSDMNQEDGQQRLDGFIRRDSTHANASNPSNRREMAAEEMHGLLDALLEAGTSYIDLPRDSASSRFLVRAKVAQFHPRDARRLRLIDFGRSLDN